MKNNRNRIFSPLLFIVITVSLSFLTSCKKEEYKTSNAIISWTGEYGLDGCGFFITIDHKKYKPQDESKIDDKFKTVDQPIVIEYEIINKIIESWCGDLPESTKTDGVRIISIN